MNKISWISVDYLMPESDRRYLALLDEKGREGFITVSFYYEDSFGQWWSDQWNIYDRIYTDSVTHWMELPEPPE